MSPVPASLASTPRWVAWAATVCCVLVAVQLSSRRDDERTLRAANVAAGQGDYARARRLAAELTDGTTAADAWFLRANVASREGRLASAERALRRSLDLRPNDWRAHRDLALILVLLGDRRAGFAEYSRAAALNPRMPALGGFGAP